jgi:hypothetical protein
LAGFINNYNPIPYAVAIRRSSVDPNNKTNKKVISEIYRYMTNNYRCEYVYKNTLLNNLLLYSERHNIENTTALAEVPVCKSKADFVLINGNAEIYEIKTELDNFCKLEGQIDDYYKAFMRVNIVTSLDKLDELTTFLSDQKVGIYVLDKKLKLVEKRKARNERRYLEHKAIFKILRKKEYENILVDTYGKLPDVSQFDYYKECFNIFRTIDIKNVYPRFLIELKKRCHVEKEYFSSLPRSVNSLIYFSNLKKIDIERLSLFFNSKYDGGKNVLSIS